jgi:hypothetical protein
MVFVPEGIYTTGIQPPLPYGVVDTTQMAVVHAPEKQCPKAIASTEGADACWVQTDLHDPVVTAHSVQVGHYCMAKAPFPGQGPNPPDGMSTWDAAQFDKLLSTGHFGPRRLCTYTEYEVAVAGPHANHRFIYGNSASPERCAQKEATPIGSMATCTNPETGLVDYGAVISQWVHLDEQLVAWACEEGRPCKASGNARLDARKADGSLSLTYVVAGGTHRVQTRQAPYTPHTFHDHGQVIDSGGCDSWGWDDGPAVCATPDANSTECPKDPNSPACIQFALEEARWAALVDYCTGRSMTDCLNRGLSAATGELVDVCPESDGALGPGQGR